MIRKAIDTATVRGEGDCQESVNDAIVKVMDELNWNSKLLKAAIVIGDTLLIQAHFQKSFHHKMRCVSLSGNLKPNRCKRTCSGFSDLVTVLIFNFFPSTVVRTTSTMHIG
jgi:hypothetical protein